MSWHGIYLDEGSRGSHNESLDRFFLLSILPSSFLEKLEYDQQRFDLDWSLFYPAESKLGSLGDRNKIEKVGRLKQNRINLTTIRLR